MQLPFSWLIGLPIQIRTPMDRSGQEQLVAAKNPRRSVQSKLSFSICSEACGPRTATAPPKDKVAEDGGINSEVRQKKDKRKSNDKLKSRDVAPNESADNYKEAQDMSGHSRKSSRNFKNKPFGGETPRKNRAPTKFVHTETSSKGRVQNGKSDNVKDSDAVNQPFYDLWSEAKKAAEENLRLFAGKQPHPFFSICRATKKSSETKNLDKSENRSWLGVEGDYCISVPPFHVFDTVQDDVAVPNWENWNFLETSLPKLGGYCNMNSSVFEVLTKPLILEATCGKDTNLDCLLVDEKMNGTYKTTGSSKLSSELPLKEQLSSPSEMVDVGCIFSWSSAYGSIVDDQCQNKLQNGRLTSYFKRSISCTDNNLWTEKYRPKISLEVCGNTESVKLLSEWLKSWQERVVQNIPNGKRRNHCFIEDSEDSSYDYQSDMDEIDCGDSLKNVLLITGPVGCGKSAAIYACAREQGFKVIEVNASSLRNGAFMRQTFGEGVDSLGLTHWLAEEQINQEIMDVQELPSCMPVFAENGLKVDSSLLSTENATEQSSHFHIANKTLFLFEEVDVVFDEDHGFISTIFKLAETTKRPIVLTSNTKQPVLPHLLDRLVLDFKAPSYSELLGHTSMICDFEKVHVSHSLLEHIIKAYAGDIRRILMLLQFWCQGFRDLTERIPCTRSPVPFDIDAVHLAIPQIIPWDLRCELSERVEEEISKALFALEQNSIFNELLQHNINSWEIIDPLKKVNAATSAKSRKKGKLRKQSIIGHTQFSDHMNHLEDLLYDSDSPSTCFQRIPKKKRCVVLSSDSDDGLASDEVKPKDISPNQKLFFGELKREDASAQANGNNFLAITNSPTSRSQEIYGVSQFDQLDESRNALGLQNFIGISEVASTSHICDTSRTRDPYTCMSESSFTEIMNFSFVSPEISHDSGITNLFDLNISPLIQPGVGLNNADVASSELRKCLENDVGTASVPLEVLQRSQEIGCFQNEEVEMPSQHQLVDDCSHPDFSVQSIPRESTACSPEVISISKTWRRLQTCQHENLKLLSSNSKDVSLVSRLTSGLADLISEADIMFRCCNPIICDNLEPTSSPCVEPDSFSWFDEQVEMGSTFAQHGLCFYTMKLAAVGSCLGCNNMPDLAQQILASSSGSTALGKLLTQESITQQYSSFKDSDIKAPPSLMPFGRESAADFYSAILPIVPARLSLVLKGVGFHEYLQFIGQISRFECSQLAESLVEKQKRRSRTRMHYLSSGANQLSSGQAELLAQSTCFTRSSSRY